MHVRNICICCICVCVCVCVCVCAGTVFGRPWVEPRREPAQGREIGLDVWLAIQPI